MRRRLPTPQGLIAVGAACCALGPTACGNAPATSSTMPTVGGPSAKPRSPLTAQSGTQAGRRPEPALTVPDIPPPKSLIVHDLIEGSGRQARRGDELAVHFTAVRYAGGDLFESIWDRPYRFELSHADVSPGFVQGLPGMRVGGRRELIVPTRLISRFPLPPSEDGPERALIYVVDLLGVG